MVSDQYQDKASTYSALQKDFEQSHDDTSRSALYRQLPSNLRGLRLLDVGCGSGQDLAYYQSLGADVSGVDASAEMLALARARQPVLPDLHKGDILEIDLPKETFDIVTSRFVLQHLGNVEAAFQKIHYLLKPDGIVFVLVGHPLLAFAANEGGYYGDNRSVDIPLYEGGIVVNDIAHTVADYLTPWVLENYHLLLCEEGPLDPSIIRTQSVSDKVPEYLLLKLRKSHG